MRKVFVGSLIAGFSLVSIPDSFAQIDRWSVVAVSGGEAPGVPGAIFDEIQRASINNAGQIAFTAILTGPGITPNNSFGLWFGAPDAPALVVRQGRVVSPQVQVGTIFSPALNDAGAIAFTSGLQGPLVFPANDAALFRYQDGQLTLLARKGQSLGGMLTYGNFAQSPTHINNAGQILFRGSVTNPNLPLDNSIFLGSNPPFTRVFSRDQNAPGTNETFTSLLSGLIALADAPGGIFAFGASTTNAKTGVWRRAGGSNAKVAFSGEPLPGGAPGEKYNDFDQVLVSAAGDVTYRTTTTDGNTFRSHLLRWSNGQVTRLVTNGQPVPGYPAATVTFVDRYPVMNQEGLLVMNSEVSDPNLPPDQDRVVFVQNGFGNFRPIASNAAPVPQNLLPGKTVDFYSLRAFAKNRLLLSASFGGGAVALLHVETGIPEIAIQGKRSRTVRKKRFVVRGTTRDDGPLAAVTVRVGNRSPLTANGLASWSRRVRLPKRRNVITAQAIDADGSASEPAKIVVRVKRQKR